MLRSSRRLALALALGLVTAATPAAANGRFPASTQLVFHPSNPDEMLLRVTFGLMLSHDAGKTFSWICEGAVGYRGVQDPAVALTAKDTVIVAAFEGLATSLDQGCSFQFVPATTKEFVIDTAVDKQHPSSAVSLTSTGMNDSSGEGSLSFHVQVVETQDDGATWAYIGQPLDKHVLAETIDPAPSRPQRLYVSGAEVTVSGSTTLRKGALLASDDRGQTWTRHDVDLAGDKSVFIAAVDPVDPDKVYLRTTSADGAKDRLLLTTDGGLTTHEIGSVTGSMLGFALSPDGSRIAIGGPSAGVLVADTSSFAFSQASTIETACLAWSPSGLHACGNPFKDGFSLGRSPDEGKTWQPILASFASLTGPMTGCSTSPTPAETCAAEWNILKASLHIGEAGGSDAGGQGGTSAGSSGASLQGGTGGVAGTDSPPAGGDDDGCSSAGTASHGAGGLAGLLGLMGLVAGRRRRRG